jgi:hypothetical protein
VRALHSCAWNSRSLLPALASVKDVEMADSTHYVIRGGFEGRDRLRVLGRVMRTSSMSLFDRLGLRDGLTCLDVGCGGGDAPAVLADGLASQQEIDEVVRELYEFAADPNTVAGTPRVVQARGRRSTA